MVNSRSRSAAGCQTVGAGGCGVTWAGQHEVPELSSSTGTDGAERHGVGHSTLTVLVMGFGSTQGLPGMSYTRGV